jgi:hypothetical protein
MLEDGQAEPARDSHGVILAHIVDDDDLVHDIAR